MAKVISMVIWCVKTKAVLLSCICWCIRASQARLCDWSGNPAAFPTQTLVLASVIAVAHHRHADSCYCAAPFTMKCTTSLKSCSHAVRQQIVVKHVVTSLLQQCCECACQFWVSSRWLQSLLYMRYFNHSLTRLYLVNVWGRTLAGEAITHHVVYWPVVCIIWHAYNMCVRTLVITLHDMIAPS